MSQLKVSTYLHPCCNMVTCRSINRDYVVLYFLNYVRSDVVFHIRALAVQIQIIYKRQYKRALSLILEQFA